MAPRSHSTSSSWSSFFSFSSLSSSFSTTTSSSSSSSSSPSPSSYPTFSTVVILESVAVLVLCLPFVAVFSGSQSKEDGSYSLWSNGSCQQCAVRSTRRLLSSKEEKEKEVLESEGSSILSIGKRRRELWSNNLPVICETNLLTLLGNILSSSPCEQCYVRSLLVSTDENKIYFGMDVKNGTNYLRKAVRLPGGESPSPRMPSYSVRDVVRNISSHITSLEILEGDSKILASTASLDEIWAIDVVHETRNTFIKDVGPVSNGISRHPTENFIFGTASNPKILKIPLHEGRAPVDTKIILAGADEGGYENHSHGRSVRFGRHAPRINPRSISACGAFLYVADRNNFCVRRVNTTSGATETVSFRNGSTLFMPFGPLSTVLTADNCNLFVTGWPNRTQPAGEPTVIQWVLFHEPNGAVESVKEAVVFNASSTGVNHGWTGVNEPSRLALSWNDTHLYVGTSNGEIFALEINRSALHRCGPYDPSNPPVFKPFPPYRSPNTEKRRPLLLLVLAVAVPPVLLLVIVVLAVWRMKKYPLGSKSPSGNKRVWTSCSSSKFEPRSLAAEDSLEINNMVAMFTSSDTSSDGITMSAITRNLESLDAPRPIPFAVLRDATEGFSSRYRVEGARGGFGDLYRTSMQVGGGSKLTDVALKVMRGDFDGMKRKQFISEVTTLSCARHAHLCKLLGYCLHENMAILVYPFISGGSLHDHLHSQPKNSPSTHGARTRTHPLPPSSRSPSASATTDASADAPAATSASPGGPVLDWSSRLSVARQIAVALRYLHEELDPPLLHRDVKSGNILVEVAGEQVKAYLADFGLARLGNPTRGPDGERGRETVNTEYRAGTIGYMAPEYAIRLKLTAKNDVYAFGIVLLEILTGRKALFWSPRDGDPCDSNKNHDGDGDGDGDDDGCGSPVMLAIWCRKSLERTPNWDYDQLSKIVDPQLIDSFNVQGGSDWERETLCAIAKLGLECSCENARGRPTMASVVERIKLISEGQGLIDEEAGEG